jgi:hypothetical protein
MRQKVNMATAIVQRAQQMYPQRLSSAVEMIGVNPPYGKKVVDARTRDDQIVRLLPADLAALAQTNPQEYMKTQERLQVLQQRASAQGPLPAQGTFEE